jgi:hypothetical protein
MSKSDPSNQTLNDTQKSDLSVPETSQDGSLGNNAKFAAALTKNEVRATRYFLQSLIRLEIGKAGARDELHHPFDYHRTAKCRHVRKAHEVGILKSVEHGSCHYGGLVTCGNVKTCPVCAPIIQNRRALEIRKFFDWAYQHEPNEQAPYKVVMLTLTAPHDKRMSFVECKTKMTTASSKMRAHRQFKRAISNSGSTTSYIKATEVKYGKNGWHVHFHELYRVSADCDVEKMKAEILIAWEGVCGKVGLLNSERKRQAFRKHSVDIVDNCRESDYIAKQGSEEDFHWGADREMASASSKIGKNIGGKTPFQLAAGTDAEMKLFMEFLDGSRSLHTLRWGPGLKAIVGVDEVTDEELAEENQTPADLLAKLSPDDWSIVIAAEAKAKVLDIAETTGAAGISNLLTHLKTQVNKADVEQAEKESKPPSKLDKYHSMMIKAKEDVPISIDPNDPENFCLTMEVDGV